MCVCVQVKNLGHEMGVLDESVSSLTREKAVLHEVHQQVLQDLQAHQDKLSMLLKAKGRLEQHVEDVRQLLPVCLLSHLSAIILVCLLSHLSVIIPVCLL